MSLDHSSGKFSQHIFHLAEDLRIHTHTHTHTHTHYIYNIQGDPRKNQAFENIYNLWEIFIWELKEILIFFSLLLFSLLFTINR